MIHVVEIKKMYSIFEQKSFINITIVRVFDHSTGKTHYAKWWGGSHGEDYLPGGCLYISDTWKEFIVKFGIKEDILEPEI
jgi:uncharacterized protein YndB with AHSA1/START domain